MKPSTRKFLRRFLPPAFTVLGGIGGWAYYYFVGCATGTCPISSSPVLMPIYGAFIGFLVGMILQPGKKNEA